jgi:hypothetical protein
MTLRIAIMQPYFFPYAGYYRLFAAADIFVVLDCVQFPRRGWVHRNQFSNSNGEFQWLTLPLVKSERDTTRICDLKFPENALNLMEDQIRRFPSLKNIDKREPELAAILSDFSVSPVQYLVRGLEWATERLGLRRPTVLSSSFGIPENLKAQDRIIEIAKRMNASHYINAPGGRGLYEVAAFEAAKLSLNFLPDYTGPYQSILQRLLNEDATSVAQEILQNTSLRAL